MVPEVTYHPRETWQSPRYPVSGPALPWAKRIDTFPAHYTASAVIPQNVAAFLRNMQRHYVVQRGFSAGYNFGVDQRGGVWEIRGWDYRCAANRGWNHRSIAVLCLVDGADPMTDEAIESVRKILLEANRRAGRELIVRPHSEIGATLCPGDGVRGQISAGLITPWEDPMQYPLAVTLAGQFGAFAVWNDHKTWLPTGQSRDAFLARHEIEMTQVGDVDEFVSYGPIVGPIPLGYDAWGVQVAG